jgi:hypothetical protein
MEAKIIQLLAKKCRKEGYYFLGVTPTSVVKVYSFLEGT